MHVSLPSLIISWNQKCFTIQLLTSAAKKRIAGWLIDRFPLVSENECCLGMPFHLPALLLQVSCTAAKKKIPKGHRLSKISSQN